MKVYSFSMKVWVSPEKLSIVVFIREVLKEILKQILLLDSTIAFNSFMILE